MSTKCPHCKDAEFTCWRDYAKHLLEKHKGDIIRIGWAKEVLKEPEEVTAKKPSVGRRLWNVLRMDVGSKGLRKKKKKKKKKTREK